MRRTRPRRGFGATAWGLGFAVFCAANVAEARGSLEVSWKAPDECPQEAEFTRLLERFLGQSVESERDQDIVILAVATRGDAFSVRINIATTAGIQRRELVPRCSCPCQTPTSRTGSARITRCTGPTVKQSGSA